MAASAPLADVVFDATNGCGVRSGDGDTVVLRLADIGLDGVVARESSLRRVGLSDAQRKKYALLPGDLLVFRVNGSPDIAGRVVAYSGPPGYTFCDHFIRLRLDEKRACAEYVAKALSSPPVRQQVVQRIVTTAGQNTISQKSLLSIQLPLPPVKEQRRIVGILEKVDSVRRKRQETIDLAERFLRAAFLERFGDPGTNPKGWARLPVGELVRVRTGKTPSRKQSRFYGGEVPWVKTAEVVNDVILETGEHVTRAAIEECKLEMFPRKSIIIAMYGEGATRGRSAMLGVEATTNQACAVIPPCDEVRPEYLWVLLQLSYERLRSLGRGGNQSNLNLGMVAALEVPVPPLPMQVEFSKIHAEKQRMGQRMKTALSESQDLYQSLALRAFLGEL